MVLKAWTALECRLEEESGASLVEYALLVALIALVAIAALQTVGGNVSQEFDNIANCIDNPGAAGCETGGP
ncbi:MAG: Flp family type IVb pilin [Acidimicrobiia bacterium]|nr:Flp family type IVb pilin [Acidimicrobiia bacterium]